MRPALIASIIAAAALAACRAPGDSTLHVGDRARTYELFVPVDKPGMPLVVALHGHGGTGKQMERSTQFDRIAAREQFVIVYPDGIDHHWNDGRPEVANGADDVAFIASLIDRIAVEHGTDRSRVYITGASNGAMMTYRLACDLSDRIAAIAPVIGNMPAAIACTPTRPLSVLAINGTADPLVPYAGGQVGRQRGEVLSAALSVDTFARSNRCNAATTALEPDVDPHDGSRTHATQFQCPPPVEVALLTLDGAGHTWPSGSQYLPKALIGGVSRDFDASERIWEFFAAH